jgi:hypothetical protein
MHVATRRAFVTAGVVALVVLASGCAVSRAGWGKGRFIVVHESASLQVRRSTIRVDEPTRDIVLNWIGARTPEGQPMLAELTVTVFDDRDRDGRIGAGEMIFQRTLRETTGKILFSDLRTPRDDPHENATVLVEARTAGGETRADSFAFRPDN